MVLRSGDVTLFLRILEDFLEVMNSHCEKLVEILAGKCGGGEFDIFPLVTHCALDIICETAMGRNINAQQDSDTPYVRAVYEASDIIFLRQRYSQYQYNKSQCGEGPPGSGMTQSSPSRPPGSGGGRSWPPCTASPRRL